MTLKAKQVIEIKGTNVPMDIVQWCIIWLEKIPSLFCFINISCPEEETGFNHLNLIHIVVAKTT